MAGSINRYVDSLPGLTLRSSRQRDERNAWSLVTDSVQLDETVFEGEIPTQGSALQPTHGTRVTQRSNSGRTLGFCGFGAMVLALCGLTMAPACSSPCESLARDHARFVEAVKAASAAAPTEPFRPHMVVAVPFTTVNRVVGAGVAGLQPVPIRVPLRQLIPGLSTLDGLQLRLQRARLGPPEAGSPSGSVGVALTLVLEGRRDALVTLDLSTRVRPRIDRQQVVLPVRAQDFSRVRPTLGPRPAKALSAAIIDLIPARYRGFAPPRLVSALANQLLGWVVNNLYRLIARNLLTDVAALTTFRWRMPPLPVRQARLHVDPRSLALSVELGVEAPALRNPDFATIHPPHQPRLHVGLPALVGLANWAVVARAIPPRVNRDYKASQSGPFIPRFSYRPQRRSLGLRLYNDKDCYAAHVWFVPSLSTTNGRLTVQLQDGRVERIDGSLLVRLGAYAQGVYSDMVRTSLDVMASGSMQIGDATLTAKASDAIVNGDEVRLGVAVSATAPTTRPPR